MPQQANGTLLLETTTDGTMLMTASQLHAQDQREQDGAPPIEQTKGLPLCHSNWVQRTLYLKL